MNIVFKSKDSIKLPGNQIYVFVHNGKKIHCDVDSLIADYKEKQAELVNISEIYKPNSNVDPEYAMETNIYDPIIIVRFDDGTYEVLDGNHRLFRAVHEGKSQILAHTLNELELRKYSS